MAISHRLRGVAVAAEGLVQPHARRPPGTSEAQHRRCAPGRRPSGFSRVPAAVNLHRPRGDRAPSPAWPEGACAASPGLEAGVDPSHARRWWSPDGGLCAALQPWPLSDARQLRAAVQVPHPPGQPGARWAELGHEVARPAPAGASRHGAGGRCLRHGIAPTRQRSVLSRLPCGRRSIRPAGDRTWCRRLKYAGRWFTWPPACSRRPRAPQRRALQSASRLQFLGGRRRRSDQPGDIWNLMGPGHARALCLLVLVADRRAIAAIDFVVLRLLMGFPDRGGACGRAERWAAYPATGVSAGAAWRLRFRQPCLRRPASSAPGFRRCASSASAAARMPPGCLPPARPAAPRSGCQQPGWGQPRWPTARACSRRCVPAPPARRVPAGAIPPRPVPASHCPLGAPPGAWKNSRWPRAIHPTVRWCQPTATEQADSARWCVVRW